MSTDEAVLTLVSKKCGIPISNLTPHMSFYRLGIDGDDAIELLVAFCDEFKIEPSEIDLRRYTIGPEGWGIALESRETISLKWAKPNTQTDLTIAHLIQSAAQGKWFDPTPVPYW